MIGRLRGPLVAIAILLALAVSVGGGTSFVAMELTMRPEFCRTCHIMEPYYQSWANSSHRNVQCVDCHYEPGLLETFEGKFKALSQLAKYVTATQGTKPWAEVSDYSCMRSGCHSARLLEGEINFGRIRFDHRHHLIGMRRGKKLRCTSCHSQIVQGDHLTVTPTTCFLCHFRAGADEERMSDCGLCHGPPPEEIHLGEFVFRHADYLDRGVSCRDCHGDVTRGTGEVPRQRCGSCHNRQEHLERYDDVEFMHRHHVTDHSVNCLECHTEIEHGLTPRMRHAQGNCSDCHFGAHASTTELYRGTGGRGVDDSPSVMYLARVTCNGCHRPPFPGAPAPAGSATYAADPLACIDCHGTGYKGMADRWQAEVRQTMEKADAALVELREWLTEEWEEGDVEEARRHYEEAAYNLGLVHLDGSTGVHNLPYIRDLIRRGVDQIGAGRKALDPSEGAPSVAVGPRVGAKEGCTNLCHVGVEEREISRAFDLPFDHATHLLKAKLDCSRCHAAEPHGTTKIDPKGCMDCHHAAEDPDRCGACHTEIAALRAREVEGVDRIAMQDLDCLSCHETVAEDASEEAIRAACDDCHSSDDPDFAANNYEAWIDTGAAPLRAVEARLGAAPADVAARMRAEIAALRRAGVHHNVAYAQAVAARLAAELDAGN